MRFRHILTAVTCGAVYLSACHDDLTQPATGIIQTTVTGLPAGTSVELRVTGPDGFEATIEGGRELGGLVPGQYTVSALDVNVDVDIYSPASASTPVTVSGAGPASVIVTYSLASGMMNVSLSGVPGGYDGAVVVTGPDAFAQPVPSGQLLTGLRPGTYAVLAAPIDSLSHVFAPTQPLQTIVVEAGTNPQLVDVTYRLATGQANVTIVGVPSGSAAAVTVAGAEGFQRMLTASETLTRLAPGRYTIDVQSITVGGHVFAAVGTSFDIAPSLVPVQATITYVQITGELRIDVTGLPAGVKSAVNVSGPNGFAIAVERSDTLVGLTPGAYIVSADTVVTGGFVYEPSDFEQTANIQAESVVALGVTYNFTGSSSLDLSVPQAYVVQTIQRSAGDVPLVAGRDAYARIFVTANEANSVVPSVRLRVFHNGSVVQTFDITANRTNTPTSLSQLSINNSWNMLLPGNLIVEGMAIDVVVDPTNAVPELNEGNNSYPAGGSPQSIDVRSLPAFQVRFVPVRQGSFTGAVSAGNAQQFLDYTESIFPMHAIDWDIHAPMTTTAPTLMSGDQNNAWGTVLSEVRALRVAEGASPYYYGVVKVDYTSGVAGLGYVPSGPTSASKAAIGWDYLPSGSEIMAHELGHNFGRNHAPCGGPSGVDQNYPYPNAAIGQFGFDVPSVAVKSSALPDIMSYCDNPWVSDYTFEGVLARREAEAAIPAPSVNQTTRTLLVWGRILEDSIVIEPAFELNQAPNLPPESGPYLLEGITLTGGTAFSYRFAGEAVADVPSGTERHFAFLIPYDGQTTPLQSIRISGAGVSGERVASVSAAPNASIANTPFMLDRVDADRVALRWDTTTAPMVMVRDASTGNILAFARGGNAIVWTRAQNVDVLMSNGVRSTTR